MVQNYLVAKNKEFLVRLLYQNPKLIILDEATNSLDRKSELEIYKNVFNWGQMKKFSFVSAIIFQAIL